MFAVVVVVVPAASAVVVSVESGAPVSVVAVTMLGSRVARTGRNCSSAV